MKKLIYLCSILVVIIFSSCGPTAVVVRQQPVAPVYAIPLAPSRAHVWVEGAWVGSRRNGYSYRKGYYTIPPRGRSYYTPGRWVKGRNGYYWQNGRW